MTEVILNDRCAHCAHKECHDGENLCNQAMKDNSFYKNAKLYKGLEVIQLPTYEELEKENAELKDKLKHRNCVDCSNHHSNIKLIKAKALLVKWVELYRPKSETALPTPIQVETEQFLKEIEK